MANEMISKDFSKYKIASVFTQVPVENDLSEGISGGFAVVGYKGKTWSYRYRGEETMLMRDDGDGPRSSLDAIIIASAKVLSKTWYEAGYVEGNSAPPDCWSGNGVIPSLQSPKRQSETCATCPRNVWGGRITENGKRAKECADAKRMAIVPLENVVNEDLGGPMLLRVPAASLADLSTYGAEIAKLGYPYYAVATKIQFDPEEAYPKFKFTAIRPLTNDEGKVILEHRENVLVERILDEIGETVIDSEGDVKPANVVQLPKPTAKPVAAKPVAKVINAEPATKPAAKSEVKPRRKQAVARAEEPEEIEDAQVVEETAAANGQETAAEEAVEEEVGEGDEDETFDAALDAKLSAFLGGSKS